MYSNKNIKHKFGFSILYSFEIKHEILDDGTIMIKTISKQPPEIKQDVLWENGLPYLQ